MKMAIAVWAAAGLVVLIGGARADDGRVWMGDSYDSGASLVYGTPESDDAPIAFGCELPARELVVTVSLGGDFQPRSGEVPMKIAAKPTAESLSMTGELQFLEEMGDTFAEARGRFTVSLARMLKQGKALEVTVGSEKRIFPLDGAAKAMKALEAACAELK